MKLKLNQLLSIGIISLSALVLSCSSSSDGGEVITPDPPGIPVNIFHEKTQTSVKVTWDKAVDANSYELILGDEGAKATENLFYTFSDLEPNKLYGLKIRSVREGKYYSEWASANFRTEAIVYSAAWLGDWKGSNVTASANAGGFPIPLGALLPPEGLDIPVAISLTESPIVSNQLVASIVGLDAYLPVGAAGKFNAVPINANNNGLSGSVPLNYTLPSIISEPIRFADIPGFIDALLANERLSTLAVIFAEASLTAMVVKMNNVNISGNFTDTQKQKADLKFIANATLTISTDIDLGGGVIDVDALINSMIGNVLIEISMNSDKQL